MNSYPENSLVVQGLKVSFQETDGLLQVLDNVCFSLQKNEFACLIGPSGSGKSTLLRALAGLIPYESGSIEFPEVHGRKPRTGLVFQKANLMPWRTLEENIALPLQLAHTPQAEINKKVKEMVELTDRKSVV